MPCYNLYFWYEFKILNSQHNAFTDLFYVKYLNNCNHLTYSSDGISVIDLVSPYIVTSCVVFCCRNTMYLLIIICLFVKGCNQYCMSIIPTEAKPSIDLYEQNDTVNIASILSWLVRELVLIVGNSTCLIWFLAHCLNQGG